MNPYKQARLDENLTQRELAIQCHVTPQTILLIEQGLFNSPPKSIRLRFNNITPLSYHNWITTQRYQNPILSPNQLTELTSIQHPSWYHFRHLASPSFKGFCVKLYFQPSILREFELQHRNHDLLISALLQSRVPVELAYKFTTYASLSRQAS